MIQQLRDDRYEAALYIQQGITIVDKLMTEGVPEYEACHLKKLLESVHARETGQRAPHVVRCAFWQPQDEAMAATSRLQKVAQ